MTGHEHWDEQAAAYALDALDEDERHDFEAHLDECSRCREQLDQHALVAAQLGALAGDDPAVAPPPWTAIRAGVVGDSAGDEAAAVVPLRSGRSAWLAAAAAVVVLVGGATAWRVTHSTGTAQPLASVDACRHTGGCHVVALHASDTSPATVLVNGKEVKLVSTSMPAPPAGHTWALWQVPRKGAPQLLVEFGTGNATAHLSLPYDATAAFAVSNEKAGTTPTTPTTVVATGNAA